MIKKPLLLGAMIGLVGACEENKKTENTDTIFLNCILELTTENDRETELVELIHQEKNNISPECVMCKNPCGNTSDYSFDTAALKTQTMADELVSSLVNLARAILRKDEVKHINEINLCYMALSSLRWLNESDYLSDIIDKINSAI